MRFLDFLNEIKFKSAKDVDYPNKVRRVIIFDKNEEYELRGKAHNLMSHAIKHLSEFDDPYMSKIVRIALNIVVQYDYWVMEKGKKYFRKSVDRPEVINLFDLINDKIHLEDKLLEPEKRIKPLLEDIKNRYESIIRQYINKAIEITEDMPYKEIEHAVRHKKTIKFEVFESNITVYHYLDLSNYAFMVEYKDRIKTLYKIDSLVDGSDTIPDRYKRRRSKILNDNLKKALGVK